MGEVYLAEDTRLDRAVALKFLHPHAIGDPTAKERLVREPTQLDKIMPQKVCQLKSFFVTTSA
jgi:serine/threonine protein kinase